MTRTTFVMLVLAAVAAGLAAAWLSRPPAAPVLPRLQLQAVYFADLPGWHEDDQVRALTAFRRSCRQLERYDDTRSLGADGIAGRAGDWKPLCRQAAGLDGTKTAARAFFERAFRPFALTLGRSRVGQFTGYYESALRGSRRFGDPYTVPLYRRPPELVMAQLGDFRNDLRGRRIAGTVRQGRLRPFPDRASIVAGALARKDLELVWVDDPIDAFFVQIQGSGRINLDDGTVMRIGYAGQNGHPYFAIGRELLRRGVLEREEISLQSIRAWLTAHPDEADAVMNRNPSYVFFRELANTEGPYGALNVPLTPGRSLAVDRRFLPLGVPLWFDGQAPDPAMPGRSRPLRRLLMAQDVGGAIRGALRGDVFWGYGDEAERIAGHMNHAGRLYLLLPAALAAKAGKPA